MINAKKVRIPNYLPGFVDPCGTMAVWRKKHHQKLTTNDSRYNTFSTTGNLPQYAGNNTSTIEQSCVSGERGLPDNEYAGNVYQKYKNLNPYINRPIDSVGAMMNRDTQNNILAGNSQTSLNSRILSNTKTPLPFSQNLSELNQSIRNDPWQSNHKNVLSSARVVPLIGLSDQIPGFVKTLPPALQNQYIEQINSKHTREVGVNVEDVLHSRLNGNEVRAEADGEGLQYEEVPQNESKTSQWDANPYFRAAQYVNSQNINESEHGNNLNSNIHNIHASEEDLNEGENILEKETEPRYTSTGTNNVFDHLSTLTSLSSHHGTTSDFKSIVSDHFDAEAYRQDLYKRLGIADPFDESISGSSSSSSSSRSPSLSPAGKDIYEKVLSPLQSFNESEKLDMAYEIDSIMHVDISEFLKDPSVHELEQVTTDLYELESVLSQQSQIYSDISMESVKSNKYRDYERASIPFNNSDTPISVLSDTSMSTRHSSYSRRSTHSSSSSGSYKTANNKSERNESLHKKPDIYGSESSYGSMKHVKENIAKTVYQIAYEQNKLQNKLNKKAKEIKKSKNFKTKHSKISKRSKKPNKITEEEEEEDIPYSETFADKSSERIETTHNHAVAEQAKNFLSLISRNKKEQEKRYTKTSKGAILFLNKISDEIKKRAIKQVLEQKVEILSFELTQAERELKRSLDQDAVEFHEKRIKEHRQRKQELYKRRERIYKNIEPILTPAIEIETSVATVTSTGSILNENIATSTTVQSTGRELVVPRPSTLDPYVISSLPSDNLSERTKFEDMFSYGLRNEENPSKKAKVFSHKITKRIYKKQNEELEEYKRKQRPT